MNKKLKLTKKNSFKKINKFKELLYKNSGSNKLKEKLKL
jgi:hypothetical protein